MLEIRNISNSSSEKIDEHFDARKNWFLKLIRDLYRAHCCATKEISND